MTNADWWARVVQARTDRDDLRPQRLWTLHKGGDHAAAIDLKAVPGIGAEIVLTVDGELRKTRLFRSHEQVALVGAIADTRTMFERQGWVIAALASDIVLCGRSTGTLRGWNGSTSSGCTKLVRADHCRQSLLGENGSQRLRSWKGPRRRDAVVADPPAAGD